MTLVMTTRGSCSTTWPSAMPSLSAVPLALSARRTAGFYAEWKSKYGAEAWAVLEKQVGALS